MRHIPYRPASYRLPKKKSTIRPVKPSNQTGTVDPTGGAYGSVVSGLPDLRDLPQLTPDDVRNMDKELRWELFGDKQADLIPAMVEINKIMNPKVPMAGGGSPQDTYEAGASTAKADHAEPQAPAVADEMAQLNILYWKLKTIAFLSAKTYPHASRNLKHYLAASGSPIVEDSNWLRQFPSVDAAINEAIMDIANQAAVHAAQLEVGNATRVSLSAKRVIVESDQTSEADLCYSSGMSRLDTAASTDIHRNSEEHARMTGTFVFNWSDDYAFDEDAVTQLSHGEIVIQEYIADAEINKLVDAGLAADFALKSQWREELDLALKVGAGSSR